MALNEALTERLAWEIEQTGRGAMALMLAGGTTPLQAYQALATRPLTPSASLEIFFSDERYVPATSDASNFRAARPLLEALALPAERTLRVRTELPLERAVEDYERRLRALLRASTRIPLGLLGLGADGHTASLFTEADLKRASGKLAVSVQRPDGRSAVSVTPQLLQHIGEVDLHRRWHRQAQRDARAHRAQTRVDRRARGRRLSERGDLGGQGRAAAAANVAQCLPS